MQFSIEGVIENVISYMICSVLSKTVRFVHKRMDWGIFVSFPFLIWLAMHFHYVIFVLYPPALNAFISPMGIMLAPLVVFCEVALFYLVVIADT